MARVKPMGTSPRFFVLGHIAAASTRAELLRARVYLDMACDRYSGLNKNTRGAHVRGIREGALGTDSTNHREGIRRGVRRFSVWGPHGGGIHGWLTFDSQGETAMAGGGETVKYIKTSPPRNE